jgi:hypothetical protein
VESGPQNINVVLIVNDPKDSHKNNIVNMVGKQENNVEYNI